jgi:hypothetical protein
VLQNSFRNGACDENKWWREATATWAIEQEYPRQVIQLDNQYHYLSAYFEGFFSTDNNGRFSIDQASQQHGSDLEQYGAYVLPWYIAKMVTPNIVGETWRVISGGASVDKAIADAVGSGGLRRLWPKFIAENWGEDPYRLFHKWDSGFEEGAHKVLESKDVPLNAPNPLEKLALPHLSGKFFDERIPAGASTVAFINYPPYGSAASGPGVEPNPDAQVEAALAEQGSGQSKETYTGKDGFAVCKHLTGKEIVRVLLAFSNSSFENDLSDPSQVAGVSPQLIATNIGCSGWQGTFNGTKSWQQGQYAGVVEHESGHISLEPDDASKLFSPYHVTGGDVQWSISGTTSDGCTYTGSYGYALTAADLVSLSMGWNGGAPTPNDYSFAFLGTDQSQTQQDKAQVTVACPDGMGGTSSSQQTWTPMFPLTSDPNGTAMQGATMSGDFIEPTGYQWQSSWHWNLTSPG